MVPHIELWTIYLKYIIRINTVEMMTSEQRKTIIDSYEFVLENLGLDLKSGQVWLDYISFLKSNEVF